MPVGPTLHILSGQQEGRQIAVFTASLTIGRAIDNAPWDLSLHDNAVSRPHAELVRQRDGTWAIVDLESSNGTQINNEYIEANEPYPLKNGDEITLGYTVIRFELSE